AGRLDLDSLSAPLAPTPPASAAGGVQLGFVEGRTRPGAAQRLYRVLAAPVSSFGRPVGTLILGQRLTGFGGPGTDPDAAGGALRSALWMEGRLAGGSFPAPLRTALAAALAAGPAPADSEFRAGGVTYRYQRTLLNPGSAYPPAHLVSVFSMA